MLSLAQTRTWLPYSSVCLSMAPCPGHIQPRSLPACQQVHLQTVNSNPKPIPCRLYQNQDDVDEQVIADCLVELAQHSAHTWVPEGDFSSNSHHVAQFTWTLGTCLQRQAALHQQALAAVRQYLLAVATSGTAAGAGVADVDSSVSGLLLHGSHPA